jgi:serine/threonine protein kinase
VRAVIVEVPGYRLAEPLGAGATGVVYDANRLADGQRVAVKVVHPELVDPQYRERLRREARAAAAVVHPGVVRVQEVGGDGNNAWLVMDRLSGPDLQRRLTDDGPLEPFEAAELLASVADAVHAMHEAGVIHRDLKPANIILNDGRPLVGDFGVARQLVSLESSTGFDLTGGSDWLRSDAPAGPPLGAMAGTVAYMAPEQWRGDPVAAAADVYALGGTLFSLLTGLLPYDRKTLPELAYAVAILPAPQPSQYGVPLAFDAVVARAMAKDPAERYATAADFAMALRAVGSVDTPPRTPLRRRWLVAVAALVLVAGGVGAVVAQGKGSTTEELTVCAEDATVRDAPRSRTVVATVYQGDHLKPIAPRDGDSWVHVRLSDGSTGWALTDFVRHEC